jgi:hypothetical protein
MEYSTGDRVTTPDGPGYIMAKRLGSPSYDYIDAYSVMLDSRRQATILPPFPPYSGNTYPVDKVSYLEEEV